MKNLLYYFCIIILSFSVLRAEEYNNFGNYMYLMSQPNARAEALGRGYSTLTGNPFYSFYNPASTCFSKDLSVTFSHLNPNWITIDNTYLNNFGASYSFRNYGTAAVNVMDFSYGEEMEVYDENHNLIDKKVMHTFIYSFNYSYLFADNLGVGISASYFNDDFITRKISAYTFDLGLLKKFLISENLINQDLYLGISLSNIANNGAKNNGEVDLLPSILRFSASYQLDFGKDKLIPFPLKASLFSEYSDLVNSRYYSEYKAGCELSIFDLLMLRGGYYYEKRYDYGTPVNANKISEFTYGFGIRIPISDYIESIPVELNFDYANLPSPVYNKEMERLYKPYNVFSINITASF